MSSLSSHESENGIILCTCTQVNVGQKKLQEIQTFSLGVNGPLFLCSKHLTVWCGEHGNVFGFTFTHTARNVEAVARSQNK